MMYVCGPVHVAVEGRITGPVLMWVEALELVLTKLAKANFPLHKVYAISGSGQQHGSVYWARGAHLKGLDPSQALVTQLQEAFAIKDSPVWMDSSTSAQCAAIEKAVGGATKLAALTGMYGFAIVFFLGFGCFGGVSHHGGCFLCRFSGV
jgi:xylulokinase